VFNCLAAGAGAVGRVRSRGCDWVDIDYIIMMHEKSHFKDVEGSAWGLYPASWKEGGDPKAAECEARKACMADLKKVVNTQTDKKCKKVIESMIKSIEAYLESHCTSK
jgi:hypothetical protein